MRRFNLIQRGTIRKNVDPSDPAITTLIGRDGLVELDYMGSAEFEYGAIPKAYTRVMANYPAYKLAPAPMYFNHHSTGNPLMLICKDECRDTILEALQQYIMDPYHTKEPTYLPDNVHGSKWPIPDGINFWWCIDPVRPSWFETHPEDDKSDWMAFYGGDAICDGILRLLKLDHDEWWMKLPEDTRNQKIRQCWDQ